MLLMPLLLNFTVILCILLISFLAYRKQSLTLSGAFFAFFLTIGLYISGGITFLAPLLMFFLSSSFFTKLKTREKEVLEKALYDKGGTRDHVQVLANTGAAFLFAVIYYFMPGQNPVIAYFVAIAACNADSWASEIGIMSRTAPFSIISFKPVQRGMSGGVTWLGLFSSACGAVFISGVYFVFMFLSVPFINLLMACTVIALFGFAGSIFDSVLGAVFQPAYLDGSTGKLTEKRFTGKIQNRKVKGFKFFSNDMVNFVSSLSAAVLAYAVSVSLL